jgi:DNA-binding PadR family transcriptional regulator
MVYPALTYLEEMGFAVAASEGTKKQFSITAEGSAHLSEHKAAVHEVWNQLAAFGRKLSRFQRQYVEDEDVADHFGSGSRNDARGGHEMKAEFRALRDELKSAIYEKLNASSEEKRRILDILRRAIGEIRGQ